MKPFARALGLLSTCATLIPFLSAQTTTRPPADASPQSSPPTAAPAPTTPTTEATRFSTFEGASPAVLDAVRHAQAVATIARAGLSTATTDPGIARAVAQAGAAIVQEGRVARSDLLAQRQAALTRLRLASSTPEREKLVSDLRTQTGQRMDDQREAARLVRDRLRELRDTTSVTPKPGGS
jgi:hypothetical protein